MNNGIYISVPTGVVAAFAIVTFVNNPTTIDPRQLQKRKEREEKEKEKEKERRKPSLPSFLLHII